MKKISRDLSLIGKTLYGIDNILVTKSAKKFGAMMSDLELLGGFSNNVYECKTNGEAVMLKFYPSSIYEKNSIESELGWILYLLNSGVNVTSPFPSLNGNS